MTTTARRPERHEGHLRERAAAMARAARRVHPELVGLVGLAALLNLWALTRNGWANTYYSAAVRSMSANWHDFLYGSFDAGGVMTVDKPPLALWVQALSVKAFGFHSASILVPQALMGVVAVVLVYDLTRRRWGGSPARWPGWRWRRRRSSWPSRATTTRTRSWCCAAPPRSGSPCGRWRTGAPGGWSGPGSASAWASRRRWAPRC